MNNIVSDLINHSQSIKDNAPSREKTNLLTSMKCHLQARYRMTVMVLKRISRINKIISAVKYDVFVDYNAKHSLQKLIKDLDNAKILTFRIYRKTENMREFQILLPFLFTEGFKNLLFLFSQFPWYRISCHWLYGPFQSANAHVFSRD